MELSNMRNVDYVIWTDGGCLSNPNGKGGYGVIIQNNTDLSVTELSQGFLSSTNNRMEVRAIIRALDNIPDGSSAIVYSDSKYAVETFNGNYKKSKNVDLWKEADALLAKKGTIIFSWVKGHDKNENNNRCDELATDAMHSANLISDDGFIPIPVKKQKTNHVPVSSMNAMTVAIPPMIPDAYINYDCCILIDAINTSKDPKFTDYANLRVFGRDFWSSKSLDDIEKYFGTYIINYAKSVLSDDANVLCALRWYARGLTIEHAIRKVLVDIEISENRKPNP